MPGRQAVTPVSQSQGFIRVWPLAVIAHGKYHCIARYSPCVHTANIIIDIANKVKSIRVTVDV